MLDFPGEQHRADERERNIVRAASGHPCVLLVDFSVFTLHNRLMVSSTNNSSNFTQEETDLAVRDPRGKTDDLPVDRDATESSHQWTDEVEYSRSPKC